MSSLYHLRDKDLGELAPVLYPFINSYRPHSKPESWRQLRAKGYKKIIKESFVDELEEVYFDLRGYYPEENPMLDVVEDEE